jgi:hypothetical protein
LIIPNSVTTIGDTAFSGCGFTGSLTIPNSINFTSIANNAFYGCFGFTGSLVIPNLVTTIGNNAFQGCSGFTSLTIGTVYIIGTSAFSGCSGLTGTLNIPNSVTTIGGSAFKSCSSITGININRATAPIIGAGVFQYMTGVSPAFIHVPSGASGYAASYNGLTVVYDL